jgi:SpoVK/Ycf46/Vps4 family AAA+-type ATPase
MNVDGPTKVAGVGSGSDIDSLTREALLREVRRTLATPRRPTSEPADTHPPRREAPVDAVELSADDPDLPDVALRFLVDQETKDVTMQVIDRRNGKVLRTVPAEDLVEMIKSVMADSRLH